MRRTPLTERLARFSARRPWLTIAAWLVIVRGRRRPAGRLRRLPAGRRRLRRQPESKQAEELIAERLPGSDADTEIVVVSSSTLTVDDPAFRAAVRDLARDPRAGAPDVRRSRPITTRGRGGRRGGRGPRRAGRAGQGRRGRQGRRGGRPRRPARRLPSSRRTGARPSSRSVAAAGELDEHRRVCTTS